LKRRGRFAALKAKTIGCGAFGQWGRKKVAAGSDFLDPSLKTLFSANARVERGRKPPADDAARA